MKKIVKIPLIVVCCFAVLYGGIVIWALIPSPEFEPLSYNPESPEYWPTEGFMTSAPEEQGMDSEKLIEMYGYYIRKHAKNPENSIDSIAVYRNGYLVSDFYFNPLYPRDSLHILNSVTKSIMSALIGIAIEQGYIESVDVPVLSFFPDKQSDVRDERMLLVTLEDLLSMETGIRSRDFSLYQWEGLFEMQQTEDWVGYIFSLPLDAEPGTRFDYSNMSSFLLSAIIEETTGMDTLVFARKYLFDPLGINDVRWEWSPEGYAIGFARMWLKPEDMAKFGMLYLQQGNWAGKQIVPEDWILQSITPHAFPKNYTKVLDENGKPDQELTGRNWQIANLFRPFSDGYGYQWWLDKNGAYSAVGVGGQYIMVYPAENLCVVVTNASSGFGVFFPQKLVDKFILPAIISPDPIKENKEAYRELLSLAGPPELHEQPRPVEALPETALRISGITYKLDHNNLEYDDFRLDFVTSGDYAEFSYTSKKNNFISCRVGLDNTYNFTETSIGTLAAYGTWKTDNAFIINLQHVGYSAPARFILTFEGENILIQEEGIVGAYTYSGTAAP